MADILDDLDLKTLPTVNLHGMTVYVSEKVDKGAIVMHPDDVEMLKDPEAYREKQDKDLSQVTQTLTEYFQDKIKEETRKPFEFSWNPWK
jgi:folate-dependent phosphoribosylglycinamide formyltransferase PurN